MAVNRIWFPNAPILNISAPDRAQIGIGYGGITIADVADVWSVSSNVADTWLQEGNLSDTWVQESNTTNTWLQEQES